MHRLDDPRCPAHVLDLAARLHRPLPVDKTGAIDEAGVRQVALQRSKAGGAEVVVVHLDADREAIPAARGDHGVGQVVHRVPLGRLHVVVRIATDVGIVHEHGAPRAIGVLAAAEPHRVAILRQQHALVDVERPAVVAGEPGHVRGIGDDQQLDAARLHRAPGLVQAEVVLGPLER